MPSSEALMTHSDPNPSNDSVAVAKQPQTTGRSGAQQLDSLCSEIVLCGSWFGMKGILHGVRTWSRLENTHKNGLESTL